MMEIQQTTTDVANSAYEKRVEIQSYRLERRVMMVTQLMEMVAQHHVLLNDVETDC